MQCHCFIYQNDFGLISLYYIFSGWPKTHKRRTLFCVVLSSHSEKMYIFGPITIFPPFCTRNGGTDDQVSCFYIGCYDQNHKCSVWADGGNCTKKPIYMNYFCRLSCGICSSKGLNCILWLLNKEEHVW